MSPMMSWLFHSGTHMAEWIWAWTTLAWALSCSSDWMSEMRMAEFRSRAVLTIVWLTKMLCVPRAPFMILMTLGSGPGGFKAPDGGGFLRMSLTWMIVFELWVKVVPSTISMLVWRSRSK